MPIAFAFTCIFLALFIIELLYFKIADHYNIIDHPNERSSHQSITLRGGGILFCIAGLIFYVYAGYQYHFFMLGLVAISTISFLDDVLTLNNKIRLTVHLMAVLLLFYQWELFVLPWYWIILAGIFVIGTINAYNFMDGINGITGGYSLITIVTLYYINNEVVNFTSNELLVIVGLALVVFNFFNFRTKAKCFAGDVGSVSIAFILIFLIGQLILKTTNFNYILLLLIYGIDSASTVFFRKLRKENIFEAHRSHFYQYLANQLRINHLVVTALYMLLQITVNCILLFFIQNSLPYLVIFVTIFTVLWFTMRFTIEGKKVLLGS